MRMIYLTVCFNFIVIIMSDFNPLDRAKVAVHRSSFDLSSKNCLRQKLVKSFLVIGRLPFLVTSIVSLLIGLLVLFPLIRLRIPVLRSIMTSTLCRYV